jgi:hypothetical protein
MITLLPRLDPLGIVEYDLTGLVSQNVLLIVLGCICF